MSTGDPYYGVFERGEVGYDPELMAPAHWAGVVLAGISGVVHLYLFVDQGFLPFLFAGVVFLAASLAVVLNVYRRLLYLLGIPFTAGQIAIWASLGMPDMAIAALDKPVQVLLILVLAYLFFREDDLTEGS